MKYLRPTSLREKFDGGNYGELARKYNLAEATVRDIVADKRKQLREMPMEGQMKLYD